MATAPPHLKNDSTPYGRACLSAVRTIAISGDDSEADTALQYCHPLRVLVWVLGHSNLGWQHDWHPLYEIVCHQAACAESESVLELSFPFDLHYTEIYLC